MRSSARRLQAVHDGYKGRVGIYQVMPVTENIGRIILRAATPCTSPTQAEKDGVWDLRRAGLQKGARTASPVSKKSTALPSRLIFTQDSAARRRTVQQGAIRSWQSAQASPRRSGSPGKGKDKRGKQGQGQDLATSEAAVRAELRKQGVVPVRIRKESQPVQGRRQGQPEDIAIFSRQLATMLAAGIPLVQAFDIVGAAMTSRRCRS
jgi:hypothetical protein